MFISLTHSAHAKNISRVSEVFTTNWKETLHQQVVVEWNNNYITYV